MTTAPSARFRPFFTAALLLSAIGACVQPSAHNAAADPTSKAAVAAPGRPDVAPDIRATVELCDQLLAAHWQTSGVTPTPAVDGATFLRRASLDLAGVIPSLEDANATRDASQGAAFVDRIVASDAYARHFTNYWDDILMDRIKTRLVDRPAFRQWLYSEIRSGTRYDALVQKLLTAEGVNSDGGRPDPSAWEPSADAVTPEGVNGAVNWLLRGVQQPQDLAGATSRVFLGVQIQCAECHDHPTEKWTQADFRRFTSSFLRVDGHRIDRGPVMGVRRVEISDSADPNMRMRRRMKRTGYGEDPPTALDGTSLEGDDPRAALAAWMTADDNPWFARAIVNRMWAYFLGSGFIEPIDDIRDGSDIAAPDVFDALVKDFVDHDHDLRRLMRVITATQAYRRSPAPAGSDPASAKLWSAFSLRPMTDVQLVDSIMAATQLGPIFEEVAGENVARLKLRLRKQFRFTFDVDEDGGDDTFTGTVPQALLLMNGTLASTGSAALEGTTVGTACRLPDTAATLTHVYLAALSRPPTPEELAHWSEFLAQASDEPVGRMEGAGPVARVHRRLRIDSLSARDLAVEDVFWALLNSSEFFFIH